MKTKNDHAPDHSCRPLTAPDEEHIVAMARAADGTPLGIVVYLSERDLRALGIDPGTTSRIAFWIDDGDIQFSPMNGGDDR